jgi:hypothetical protein
LSCGRAFECLIELFSQVGRLSRMELGGCARSQGSGQFADVSLLQGKQTHVPELGVDLRYCPASFGRGAS